MNRSLARYFARKGGCYAATAVVCTLLPSIAITQVSIPVPPPSHKPGTYEILRYDEDWSFLKDPVNRSDWLDPIKYMPFGRGGSYSYLSIGGEFRSVAERVQNDNWGGTPYPTNQFWLQRFQLHFDTHFDPRPRFFIQFESGLEEGRAGGPRPIDEKRLDFLENPTPVAVTEAVRIGAPENRIAQRNRRVGGLVPRAVKQGRS